MIVVNPNGSFDTGWAAAGHANHGHRRGNIAVNAHRDGIIYYGWWSEAQAVVVDGFSLRYSQFLSRQILRRSK